MIKNIINLEDSNREMFRDSEKAMLLIYELIESYSFMGYHPTEEEAAKLSNEAERIMCYMNIISDYVFKVKNGLQKSTEDLTALFDEAKEYKEKKVSS